MPSTFPNHRQHRWQHRLVDKISAAEDEKENVDDKGKKPMREEDLPQEQAEGEEEADDTPGSRTDMELAWENLEVAKYIYEHESQGNHAKELAGNRSMARKKTRKSQVIRRYNRCICTWKQHRITYVVTSMLKLLM